MSTGWNFFFALLIADMAGAIAVWLGLTGKTPWIMGAIVFVLFVVMFTINSMIRKKRKSEDSQPKTEA